MREVGTILQDRCIVAIENIVVLLLLCVLWIGKRVAGRIGKRTISMAIDMRYGIMF